jgi:predicted O-methyltransferase YrrM
MYSRTELALKYLHYAWHASNGKGHGIHSPFVYEFVTKVLNDREMYYPFPAIETLRSALEKDRRKIMVEDNGKTPAQNRKTTVSAIAHRALSTQKFGRLLFRIANFYQPKTIIELGTSLGISGAYLASADPDVRLVTLEGSAAVAEIAGENFSKLGLQPVRRITGNFDNTLKEALQSAPPVDLAYIDGNHRKEPLLHYFHQLMQERSREAIFILHDIHWSRGMEAGWEMIKDHAEVMLTIDLFSAGIVFFRDQFRVKQHFTIRF